MVEADAASDLQAKQTAKDAVVELAIGYGLLSTWTSYVAVEARETSADGSPTAALGQRTPPVARIVAGMSADLLPEQGWEEAHERAGLFSHAIASNSHREFLRALRGLAHGGSEWKDNEVERVRARLLQQMGAQMVQLAALRADAEEAASGAKIRVFGKQRKLHALAKALLAELRETEAVIGGDILPSCRRPDSQVEWQLLHAAVADHAGLVRAEAGLPTPRNEGSPFTDSVETKLERILQFSSVATARVRARSAIALATQLLRAQQTKRATDVVAHALSVLAHAVVSNNVDPASIQEEVQTLKEIAAYDDVGPGLASRGSHVACIDRLLRVDGAHRIAVPLQPLWGVVQALVPGTTRADYHAAAIEVARVPSSDASASVPRKAALLILERLSLAGFNTTAQPELDEMVAGAGADGDGQADYKGFVRVPMVSQLRAFGLRCGCSPVGPVGGPGISLPYGNLPRLWCRSRARLAQPTHALPTQVIQPCTRPTHLLGSNGRRGIVAALGCGCGCGCGCGEACLSECVRLCVRVRARAHMYVRVRVGRCRYHGGTKEDKQSSGQTQVNHLTEMNTEEI